jgi:hypothetical protein
MLRFVLAACLVLHGLVHLMYFGQSRRLFELQPRMVWPDGSWAFSALLGDVAARVLARVCCALAAAGVAAGGTAALTRQDRWRSVIVGVASFSASVVILFCDGKLQRLADQGGLALLTNVAILVAVPILRWPGFDF